MRRGEAPCTHRSSPPVSPAKGNCQPTCHFTSYKAEVMNRIQVNLRRMTSPPNFLFQLVWRWWIWCMNATHWSSSARFGAINLWCGTCLAKKGLDKVIWKQGFWLQPCKTQKGNTYMRTLESLHSTASEDLDQHHVYSFLQVGRFELQGQNVNICRFDLDIFWEWPVRCRGWKDRIYRTSSSRDTYDCDCSLATLQDQDHQHRDLRIQTSSVRSKSCEWIHGTKVPSDLGGEKANDDIMAAGSPEYSLDELSLDAPNPDYVIKATVENFTLNYLIMNILIMDKNFNLENLNPQKRKESVGSVSAIKPLEILQIAIWWEWCKMRNFLR